MGADNLIDIVRNYRDKIRILEEENQRLRAENDPDALQIVHALGVTSANDEVRKLKAELETANHTSEVQRGGAAEIKKYMDQYVKQTEDDAALIAGLKVQLERTEREEWAKCEARLQDTVDKLTVEAYDVIYADEPEDEREPRWKWVMAGIRQMKDREDRLGIHLSHCNFGEHSGTCKYCEDNCPALTSTWSWFGQALDQWGKLRESLWEIDEHSEESLKELCYNLIGKEREWRDRFVGTLMMLSYDGCITDSRAREIAGVPLGEWRNYLKIASLGVGDPPTK